MTMIDQEYGEAQARAALSQVPDLAGSDVTLTWLSGGAAHKNYLVTSSKRKVVLKLWNMTWEALGVISPSPVVMQNTILAGEFGVGAKVLAVLDDPTALLIEYLPGARNLDASRPDGIPLLSSALHRLHDSGGTFNNDYIPFAEARKMMACARQRGIDLPVEAIPIQQEMKRVERALDLRVNDFVPCHNDVIPANVLESERGVHIVDYDLAGNNDRCYDLGIATVYFDMDPDQIHRLCESYFGGNDERQAARTRLFAIAADWTCVGVWLVAQSMSNTNDDYDYQGELNKNLRGLEQKLGASDYGTLLQRAAR